MIKRGNVLPIVLSVYLGVLLFASMGEAVDTVTGNVTSNNNDEPLLMAKQHRRHSNNKHRGEGGGGRDGKTTTTVQLNEFMIGTIGLGDGDFKVFFDSGSRGTWVFGKDVEEYFIGEQVTERFHHTFYDEDKSNTFKTYKKEPKKADLSVAERYFDICALSGKSGYETLQVGDEVKMKQARFQIASKIQGPYNQFTDYDGMFGLEFESTLSDNLSVFSQMVGEGLLSKNLFSVYMTNDGLSGEIMFGGWDKARVRGPIEVVDVTPPKADGSAPWEVQVKRLRFGENRFTRNYPALVDTGSASIIIPKSVLNANNWMKTHKYIAEALDKKSDNAGFVPCTARDTLPPLAFGIGGRKGWFSLSGEDYTASPNGALTFFDKKKKTRWCALLVTPGEEDKITLGVPFFRRYHTIFFHDHSYEGSDSSPKVGFGEIDHNKKREAEQGKQQEMSNPDYYPTFWCGGTIFGESCS